MLFALVYDPDAEVKDLARTSLETLPDALMDAVLAGETHPAILSHLARAGRDDEGRCEKIALNPAADDATIAYLATLPSRRVVDIIANNQERLMRAPEIVEALGANPHTGRATLERILAFLGMDLEHEGGDPGGTLSDEQASAALAAVLGEELAGHAAAMVQEDNPEIPKGNQTNLHALIQTLSVFQKAKLARLGNKEARGLLVRDPNKVVSLAAITSPKISDTEVVSYAQSRNVCDEVLRMIAGNRQWTRSYPVKLALATNPKTPQAMAMKFVNFLQDNDVRALVRSKDVPTAVSTHARRILMKKGKI